jgi:hypothetical protein
MGSDTERTPATPFLLQVADVGRHSMTLTGLGCRTGPVVALMRRDLGRGPCGTPPTAAGLPTISRFGST